MTPEAIATCPKIRRRVVGSNVWILSFGDLVTLLLGFFVAIIGYSMQNPVLRGDKAQPAGTTIAEDKVQGRDTEVRKQVIIPVAGFDIATGGLVEIGHKILIEQLNLDGIRVEESSIESCFGDGDTNREQSRFTVMNRALAVAGQVLDRGVPSSTLQVESPGSSCPSGAASGEVLITVVGRKIGTEQALSHG